MEFNSYGTTQGMVIDEVMINGTSKILAIDSKGLYLTTTDKVGHNLADVNRYGSCREKVNETLENHGYNSTELIKKHKDIVVAQAEYRPPVAKKINPLKASKRKA